MNTGEGRTKTAAPVVREKPNAGKELIREVHGIPFKRIPVHTHFIREGENFSSLIKKYVVPHYKKADIVAISEKILALCQKRTIHKENLKIGFLARLLSPFVTHNPAYTPLNKKYKLQAIIYLHGSFKVLFAAIMGGIGKLIGRRGWFYILLSQEAKALDGFTSLKWSYYDRIGVRTPWKPDQICQEIKNLYSIDSFVVDANNIDVEIMGMNRDIQYNPDIIREIMLDNPGGQGDEQTPFVIIRKA